MNTHLSPARETYLKAGRCMYGAATGPADERDHLDGHDSFVHGDLGHSNVTLVVFSH